LLRGRIKEGKKCLAQFERPKNSGEQEKDGSLRILSQSKQEKEEKVGSGKSWGCIPGNGTKFKLI